jgi:hypothetical protein
MACSFPVCVVDFDTKKYHTPEQRVNDPGALRSLRASRAMVPGRIHLTLRTCAAKVRINGGVAKLVIALACQAGGRGFKSRRSRSFIPGP